MEENEKYLTELINHQEEQENILTKENKHLKQCNVVRIVFFLIFYCRFFIFFIVKYRLIKMNVCFLKAKLPK